MLCDGRCGSTENVQLVLHILISALVFLPRLVGDASRWMCIDPINSAPPAWRRLGAAENQSDRRYLTVRWSGTGDAQKDLILWEKRC